MPTFFRSVNPTPTQLNSSGPSDVWYIQYRSDRPGEVVNLAVGSSTPSADTDAKVVLNNTTPYIALRLHSERLYAWGTDGGTVVVNRD